MSLGLGSAETAKTRLDRGRSGKRLEREGEGWEGEQRRKGSIPQ